MANTYCDLCKRRYWDGDATDRTLPLAADGDYCVDCAVAACAAVDWLLVQATDDDRNVTIPLVEWQAVMDRWTPEKTPLA